MNLRSARKLFSRAPATHRPMARWLWNDHLDPNRLAAQLDRLLDMGLGGALIRPGHGLPPGTYLSDAWFEAMSAVVRRARKRHASLWIMEDFDDPWTREIVRGIAAERPEFATKVLRMTWKESIATEDESKLREYFRDDTPTNRIAQAEPLAAFEITSTTGHRALRGAVESPLTYKSIAPGDASAANSRKGAIVFCVETWPDVLSGLDPAATRALIDTSHALYHQNLRRYFGNTFGICMITNAGLPVASGVVPWDDDIPHLFEESFGYSLIEKLPHLFFELKGCERIRFDFWSMISDLFDEGFSTPFEQWCDEHQTPGAIGFRSRFGLYAQVVRGGARAWHSAGFSYSIVTERLRHVGEISSQDNHAQWAIEVRETSSLRRQIDRAGGIYIANEGNTVFTESGHVSSDFLITGEGIEFHERPFCVSSLSGVRKSTPRPSLVSDSFVLGRETPVSNAAARVSWISEFTKGSAEVLVLGPMESLKMLAAPRDLPYSLFEPSAHHALVASFSVISQALADAHIDFDIGDEQILARHGSVEQRGFKVGRAMYRIVVLPPSVNLRASTLALLHDFAMSGGHVIAAGTIPELIDGQPSEPLKKFFQDYGERIVQGIDFGDYRALIGRLVQLGARTVAALGAGGETRPAVFVRRGRWDALEVITLVNGGMDKEAVTVEWVPDVAGVVELWDPTTGRMEPIATCEQDATARVPLTLAPGAARLLVVIPGDAKSVSIDTRPWVVRGRLKPAWTGRRMQPNAYALAECRIAMDGGEWIATESVREQLGARIDAAQSPVTCGIEWRFTVDSSGTQTGNWHVAVELGEDGSLTLDGANVPTESRDALFDPAISTAPLPSLSSGDHRIALSRSFAEAGDLQPPWILGPFRVTPEDHGERRLVVGDDAVSLGPWSESGLPSYFGEVVYRAEVEGATLRDDERAMLEIEWLSHAGEVRVNGRPVRTVFAAPYECDLTDHWGPGKKTIEIAVTNSPDGALAGLRGLGEFDVARAGLAASPSIAIYGRGGPDR